MNVERALSFALFLFSSVYACLGLKSLIIKVPEYAKSGDTVTLACEYDLEDVALYTIKWYWNEVEFYRFVPKESPPSQYFFIQNIKVDVSKSGPTEVTLRDVRRQSSGLYKCEVSADAPLFHTEIKGAFMTVLDVPQQPPSLHLSADKIEIGKTVQAKCSLPAPQAQSLNFTWTLNNRKVLGNTSYINLVTKEGNETFKESSVEIKAQRVHFADGKPLLIKCSASLFTVWSASAQAIVLEESPFLAPILLSTSSQTHPDGNQLPDRFDFFGLSAAPERISSNIQNGILLFATLLNCYLMIIR